MDIGGYGWLLVVTRGYVWLQRLVVTGGCELYEWSRVVTGFYSRFWVVTDVVMCGYKWLRVVTNGYRGVLGLMELQVVMDGYEW